ncbi:MAG: TonB-dependent receptor plug domain-containing protein [Sulfurospirillum sp.]
MFENINRYIAIIIMLVQVVYAQNIDALLNKLAQKDDLSVHTKKESAGYLTIFTRQDLDRMKVKSLKELIEKIPFVRYNEDSRGLSAPYYQPYQANNPARIRIYINDREFLSPLFGGGFQILGQIDMAYIDHVEIYMGIPSYEISIEPTTVVIKAYTKTGKRENTTLVGVSGGSYGTNDAYGYISKDMKDFSYFVYGNHRNLKREKLYKAGSILSRSKESEDFYAQVTMPTSRFEFQVIKGSMGNFIGQSWNMTPKDSGTDFSYLYTGYSYKSLDKSLKANINYSYLHNDYRDGSNAPIGLNPPFYTRYYNERIKVNEHLLDTQITKKLKIDKLSLLLGFGNRYKKFTNDVHSRDDVEVTTDSNYNSENITSIFSEADYLLDEHNRLVLSANIQKYFENAKIKDEMICGARIGHLYSTDNFTQKSFLFYGKFRPTPYELFVNDSLGYESNNLNSEEAYSVSTKSIWRYKDVTTSLLLARTVMNNSIYFDLGSFKNNNNRFIFDSASFKSNYNLNDTDKIEFNFWVVFENYGKNSNDRYHNRYGGYLTLFKKIAKIDTYNSIAYRGGYSNASAGWNYNLTLSYPYSKHLSFFLKGENLFKDALKTDYYRVNPLTLQVTTLDNISVFDRTVWVGMEYEF